MKQAIDPDVLDAEHGYEDFLKGVRKAFANMTHEGKRPVFTTDASGLFDVFLAALPEEHRQHYTCHACRRFIERFGGLVIVHDDSTTETAIWPNIQNTPVFFLASVTAIEAIVRRAKVTGVFVSDQHMLGEPVTGTWNHLAVQNFHVYSPFAKKRPNEVVAEKLQDYIMLQGALSEYTQEHAEQAVRILRSDTLFRAEKVIGPAEFFLALHHSISKKPKNSRHRSTCIWRAVAHAPAGFAHIKSSMIGTLLDDIKQDSDLENIIARFKEKMAPDQYQRPTAAPSTGAIEAAEKLVTQMGIESALRRRYAWLLEVLPYAIWAPKEIDNSQPHQGGVFDHLKIEHGGSKIDLPAVIMTWAKFVKDILPGVDNMEVEAAAVGNYFGFLTAADPESKPILQWDREDDRNPFSHYFYAHGSSAKTWGLISGRWTKVRAITRKPSFFKVNMQNDVDGVFFILEGAHDENVAGSALFPEMLKSELHGVRSVIEAHSNKTPLEGRLSGTANGLCLQNKGHSVKLRVIGRLGAQSFIIDRLE